MTTAIRKRPKHLALFKIRLPISGLVSILHRISGAVLFLFFIPLGLAALQGSLGSADDFARWVGIFRNPLVKLILIGFIWAYLHHFCAGIRYLFLDVHKGIDMQSARLTSRIVMFVSFILTIQMAGRLW